MNDVKKMCERAFALQLLCPVCEGVGYYPKKRDDTGYQPPQEQCEKYNDDDIAEARTLLPAIAKAYLELEKKLEIAKAALCVVADHRLTRKGDIETVKQALKEIEK